MGADHRRTIRPEVAREFEPFDYGRIEFRLDRDKGEVNFIEINLNCNLWSEKVMAKAAAAAGLEPCRTARDDPQRKHAAAGAVRRWPLTRS